MIVLNRLAYRSVEGRGVHFLQFGFRNVSDIVEEPQLFLRLVDLISVAEDALECLFVGVVLIVAITSLIIVLNFVGRLGLFAVAIYISTVLDHSGLRLF